MNIRKWFGKNIWIWGIIGSFVMWGVISGIAGFVSLDMLLTNATLASFLVLISLGQMTVITSGNGAIDLSMQFTVALGAYVASEFMHSSGILVGFLAMLAVCIVIGAANAAVNLYLKVPPMITTLAVGYIVFSGVLVTSSMTTGMPVKDINFFAQQERWLGISPMIFVAAAIALIMAFVLYYTKYGKRLHAIGQNREAARLAGINISATVFTTFILSSVLAGIAGTFLGGFQGGAFQDMGVEYLMPSVAAVVIGGASIAGGRSSVAGVVSGSLLLTFITSFLTNSQLPKAYQYLIQGVLLMVILVASVPKGKRAAV